MTTLVPMQIVSVGEASRLLSVSSQTVRMMERDGRLPPVYVTSNGWRLYGREQVEALAAERRRRMDAKNRARGRA